MSGNGPQFDSGEMREFAKSYKFTYVTTVVHTIRNQMDSSGQ